MRFGSHETQMFNGSDCDTLSSKKTGASLVCNKRAVFILGALFLLVSSAALVLGVLNLIQIPDSDKQAGAFAANHSQQSGGGGGGEDIAARMRSLEESLGQLQARFQLHNNMSLSGSNETAISTLSSRVDQLESQLNDMSASLASLSAGVNVGVELYRGCYKDISACSIMPHPENAYLYLCQTPLLALNVTVRSNYSHTC